MRCSASKIYRIDYGSDSTKERWGIYENVAMEKHIREVRVIARRRKALDLLGKDYEKERDSFRQRFAVWAMKNNPDVPWEESDYIPISKTSASTLSERTYSL